MYEALAATVSTCILALTVPSLVRKAANDKAVLMTNGGGGTILDRAMNALPGGRLMRMAARKQVKRLQALVGDRDS